LKAENLNENFNNPIYGVTTLMVSSSVATGTVVAVDILSPLDGAIETQPTVLLLAQAPSLPNSSAQVYLNGFLIDEVPVDGQGNVNYTLSGLKEGKNTLLISIKSLTDQELGKSEQIEFTYFPTQADIFKKITVTPDT
jgi:hypothetical protein